MPTVTEKIAFEVSDQLGGVPWGQLEQELGIPREEIVYRDLARYSKSLQDALAAAEVQLTDVVLSFQVKDDPATSADEVVLAMQAWQDVQQELSTVGSRVLEALRQDITMLDPDNALVVSTEHYRAVISSTYLSCLYGVLLHLKGMMQLSEVAPEDIVESADNLVKTLNGLTKLGEMGLLDPLKKKVQATSGIPAGVAIAILVVLGIAIIAWCVVALTAQMEVNRNIRLLCEEARRTGDTEGLDRCKELLEMNSAASQGGPLKPVEDLVKSLGQLALFAGIGYALFKVAGPLAQKWKAST